MEKKDVLAVGQEEIMQIDQDVTLVIANAEKQIEVLEKILGVAIQRTNNYDWVDQMGKPYLTASGAEKLMPLFGISLAQTDYKKNFSKDEKGDYYVYQYKGTFSWKGGSIEAIGACSSRDKFFAWNSQDQTYKPLPEVDETNIMKAAYSNMMVNGITRLLGIRNLTWEQVEKFGIKKDGVSKVEYRGSPAKATSEDKKKQDEIIKMLNEICSGDQKSAESILMALTTFKGRDEKQVPGVNNPRKLTGKRLDIALENVKKEHKVWQGQE